VLFAPAITESNETCAHHLISMRTDRIPGLWLAPWAGVATAIISIASVEYDPVQLVEVAIDRNRS
jgi:hypothetical protein